jgi:hypothetical protein
VSFHHLTMLPNYQQFRQLHSVREAANSGCHFLFDDITPPDRRSSGSPRRAVRYWRNSVMSEIRFSTRRDASDQPSRAGGETSNLYKAVHSVNSVATASRILPAE